MSERPPFEIEDDDFAVTHDGRFLWVDSMPEYAGGSVGWWVWAHEILPNETLGEREKVALWQIKDKDSKRKPGDGFKPTTPGTVN